MLSSRYWRGRNPPGIVNVIFMLLLHVAMHLTDPAEARCVFPNFLRKDSHVRHPRTWVTQIMYTRGTNQWESYVSIEVTEHQLIARRYHKGRCVDNSDNECSTSELYYTQTCDMHINGKYKVRHNMEHKYDRASRRQQYRCIEFNFVNNNLIMTKQSDIVSRNGFDMCDTGAMKRNEWPWLAKEQTRWNYCPMVGGYDFRTYTHGTRKRSCNDFKPNRLESECVLGEGFMITYASRECSPFDQKNISLNLQCWGHWNETGYTFVMAGQSGSFPQFGFRFPTDIGTSFTEADMYFSPVAPLVENGEPAVDTIEHYDIRIRQTEPGLCYDESEECSDGLCTDFRQASLCKKTCGMCNFFPTSKAECYFDNHIRGDWVMFEKDRKEIIKVDGVGSLKFDKLGRFVCKAKSWNRKDYKLLSYYRNGCRPRFTCLRMEDIDNDVKAQFQLSDSTLTDQSIDSCATFEDDPLPVAGAVRSAKPKLIIPKQKTKTNTCGINGSINVTMVTGQSTCHGTISDWNRDKCGFEPRMNLTLFGSCDVTDRSTGMYQHVFTCDTYVTLEEDYSLLITRTDHRQTTYSCWIIQTYAERMFRRPWKEAYLLDRAQCGWSSELNPTELKQAAKLALKASTDIVDKPCSQPPFTGKPYHTATPYSPTSYGFKPPRTEQHRERSGVACTRGALSWWILALVLLIT